MCPWSVLFIYVWGFTWLYFFFLYTSQKKSFKEGESLCVLALCLDRQCVISECSAGWVVEVPAGVYWVTYFWWGWSSKPPWHSVLWISELEDKLSRRMTVIKQWAFVFRLRCVPPVSLDYINLVPSSCPWKFNFTVTRIFLFPMNLFLCGFVLPSDQWHDLDKRAGRVSVVHRDRRLQQRTALSFRSSDWLILICPGRRQVQREEALSEEPVCTCALGLMVQLLGLRPPALGFDL